MKVSPLRALTPVLGFPAFLAFPRRNESKPVEGIDTFFVSLTPLTPCLRRNESKPVEGIDTI